MIDTLLGDRSALDESDRVTIGLYIVVNDGNDYVVPDTPFTGDEGSFGMYLALMCISGILLVILWMDRRRERRCDGEADCKRNQHCADDRVGGCTGL